MYTACLCGLLAAGLDEVREDLVSNHPGVVSCPRDENGVS
jgi:hypothetical protein